MYNVYTLFQQNKYIIFCTWSRNSSSALFLWNCKWYVIIVLYCSDKDDRCKIILSRQNWSWIQVVLMILDDDKVTQITIIVSIQKKIVFWVIHYWQFKLNLWSIFVKTYVRKFFFSIWHCQVTPAVYILLKSIGLESIEKKEKGRRKNELVLLFIIIIIKSWIYSTFKL